MKGIIKPRTSRVMPCFCTSRTEYKKVSVETRPDDRGKEYSHILESPIIYLRARSVFAALYIGVLPQARPQGRKKRERVKTRY